MPFDSLAFDAGARTYDLDGRMHVRVSHISKACVSPYRGSEIPNSAALGLEPDRVYQLLRDPEELAKSVPTWNGVQLLIKHTPVSADDPQHDKVAGSLGTDAAWHDPYLDNSITIWDGEAITGVETGEQRQLSGGYHYRADMTPGMYQGTAFDGVMRDIRGNHVALVKAGRAGADVMVMDSAMSDVATSRRKHKMGKKAATLSPRTAVALGALQVYLPPKLAKGQAMPDLRRLIAGASTGKIMADRVKRAVQGRLAQDADLEDLSNIIDALKGGEEVDVAGQPVDPPGDPDAPAAAPGDPPAAVADPSVDPLEPDDAEDDDLEMKVRELLAGKLDDADLEMLIKLIQPEPADPAPASPDNPPPTDDPQAAATVAAPPDDDKARDNSLPRPGGGKDNLPPALVKENQVDKPAMDAAIAAAVAKVEAKNKVQAEQSVADAITRTTVRLNARDDATRFVRPWIGEIAMAMDTAEDVYRLALDTLQVPTKDVPPEAFRAMLSLVPKPGENTSRPARLALDAAAVSGLEGRFPALKNARVVG